MKIELNSRNIFYIDENTDTAAAAAAALTVPYTTYELGRNWGYMEFNNTWVAPYVTIGRHTILCYMNQNAYYCKTCDSVIQLHQINPNNSDLIQIWISGPMTAERIQIHARIYQIDGIDGYVGQ